MTRTTSPDPDDAPIGGAPRELDSRISDVHHPYAYTAEPGDRERLAAHPAR